jgi:hypothetical protein
MDNRVILFPSTEYRDVHKSMLERVLSNSAIENIPTETTHDPDKFLSGAELAVLPIHDIVSDHDIGVAWVRQAQNGVLAVGPFRTTAAAASYAATSCVSLGRSGASLAAHCIHCFAAKNLSA